MVVGIIASGISGYLAIAGLLAFVRTRSYDVFVIYRVVIGIVILSVIATGLRSATF
jgi:undecaprenyl-diphosphatase